MPHTAKGGAWTQPPGHLYGRLSYAYINSSRRFDAEGNRIGLEGPDMPLRGTEYQGREARFYFEYGLLEGFSLYGSSAMKRIRLVEPLLTESFTVLPETIHQTTGVGDIYLGGRLGLQRGSEPVSIAGEVKVPAGYSSSDNPALGNGYVDATFRALVGTSADWIYATSDIGWTHRWGPYQDQASFSFELGVRVARYYSARGVIRNIRSLGNRQETKSTSAFDPALSSPRSTVFEIVVGYEILPGLSLEAGLANVHSGRNTLAGTTIDIGVAWSFQARRKTRKNLSNIEHPANAGWRLTPSRTRALYGSPIPRKPPVVDPPILEKTREHAVERRVREGSRFRIRGGEE